MIAVTVVFVDKNNVPWTFANTVPDHARDKDISDVWYDAAREIADNVPSPEFTETVNRLRNFDATVPGTYHIPRFTVHVFHNKLEA